MNGADRERLAVAIEAILAANGRFALWWDHDVPGRPWDDHPTLRSGEVIADGIALELAGPEGRRVGLTVHGVTEVTVGPHPWAPEALCLRGDLVLESRVPRRSLLGVPLAPKTVCEEGPALWLVR